MKQSPSLGANRNSAGQEISHLMRNQNVHHRYLA